MSVQERQLAMALRFKILDVPVAIGFDFLLIMLLLGAVFWADAPDPTAYIGIWMAVVTVSVLLHELGHAAVAESFGAPPQIRLHGGGGATMMPMLPPRQTLLVAAAGPATGIVVGGITAAVAAASPSIAREPLVVDVIWINLGWGLLNLMPMPGLDGGAIFSSLVTVALRRPAESVTQAIGFLFAMAVIAGLVALGYFDWAFVIGFLVVMTALRTGSIAGIGAGRTASNPAELIREGRYEEAFLDLRSHLGAHPEDTVALVLASDALRLMTDYEGSLPGYEEVLRRNPDEVHALRGRICVLGALGRREEAMADLRRLASLSNGPGAISLASSLYALDLHADGYGLTHAPMRGDATILRIMENMAAVFEYTTGRLDEALGHVERLLVVSPDARDLHELRALVLSDLGRHDEARAAARRATGAAPRHPEFKQTIGLVERMAGNAGAALQPLVESASARPRGARARGELIACFAQLGQLAEANSALETLPGYARRDAFVLYGQAAMAAVAGSAQEARRFLDAAASLRPELGLRALRDPVFAAHPVMASSAPAASAGGGAQVG